jgi:aryl-alcohol dehydrogenase-like predicted oxidoreductase
MWGMAGWSGSDDEESLASLDRAIARGCTFFDTAWAYGGGHSEQLLGHTLRKHADKRLYVATKIPPMNGKWPARDSYRLEDTFPAAHIREFAERSLRNLGIETIDLLQFHVWSDAWAEDPRWQRAVRALKDEGLVRAMGISINRWQPTNAIRALETGAIDAVQVVYNIFDQNPEDELFPFCREHGIAVIARVPFDEGSLTGTLTAHSTWPQGDFRNLYFDEANLQPTLERVERLKVAVPEGMTLAELALRYILESPDVSTVIPGMRKARHVDQNLGVSDGTRLEPSLLDELKRHRWVRTAERG